MLKTAGEIAQLLQGKIEGDASSVVERFSKIEDAQSGSLTFLANPDYESFIYATKASVIIVGTDFQPRSALPASLTLIRVQDPYSGFARLLEISNSEKRRFSGIHPSAVIDHEAQLGQNCHIAALVVIEKGSVVGEDSEIHAGVCIGQNVKIGKGALIHSGVQIADDCIIGDHCTIQANAVIGSDGFGFAPQTNATYRKVPQIGNVIIEDGCEIGALTTIDRATMGSTIIESGVKLDNHIQVAHNVRIGKNTVIAAQTGIAGSTSIGANCMIGGQVGFAGHIKVADGVKIAAQSGVTKSITLPNTIWQGTPAMQIQEHQKQLIALRKLTKEKGMDRLENLESKWNQT